MFLNENEDEQKRAGFWKQAKGRYDQPWLCEEPRRRGDHARQRVAAWHGNHFARGGRRRPGR